MKKTIQFLAILILVCAFINPGQAQSVDNKGKDFYLTFMPNTLSTSPNVELHLTADANTTVTIDYPINSPTFNQTVNVGPGAVTIVSIPVGSSNGWTAGVVSNNGVHAYSTDEFVCYMINRRNYTSDAALGLPKDALNTLYVASGYYSNLVTADRGEFAVVAPFDSTTVTVTPSVDLQGGYTAGTPFSFMLNKGETFLAVSSTSGTNGDITGSIIDADKPVGVTSGNNCTNVPAGTVYCDHIFEVAQPVQTWGLYIPVVNLPNRGEGSIYRVLASEDNTTVMMDGSTIATLNQGEYFETSIIPGAHVFEGDKPIYVVQYMTGSGRPQTGGIGDPAMGNMIPSAQYLSAYTFSTVGGGQFVQNYVTIIAEDSDVTSGNIMLDGAVIPAANFTSIAGSGLSYSIESIADGTHTTQSILGHGITVEGYNTDDSYIYPGGARFQFINPVGDANPPICQVTFSNDSAFGSATDNRPSEDVNGNGILDPGEDLNGNGQIDEDTGIFFVELDPSSTNLNLVVDPFTPGDPVVTYTVNLIDPNQPGSGMVTATDGAGNQCSSIIDFTVAVNNTPTCQIDPAGPFTIDENQNLTFNVLASDADAGDM
ncbi:MAG: IgGFc-binding protein, partial [Calditrichia bacterium]